MTNEKYKSLTRYQALVKDKIESGVVPEKHKGRAVQYRNYLLKELRDVSLTLERAREEGIKK